MNANRTIFRALLKGTAVAWLIALGTPLRADPYLRQPIDVEHYRFALTLTDSSDRILGEAQIRLKLLAGGMTQVALDLADARDARNGRGSVHDLPDAGPTYLEEVGLRRLSSEFGDVLEAVNKRQRMPFKFNITFDAPGHPLQYYCRADHYSYARYGIPSVAFSRGEHMDYHQVTDEAQYIDYGALARVANFVRDAAVELATRAGRPKLDKPKTDPTAQCVQ